MQEKEITYGDFEVYNGDKALLKINYASAYAVTKTVQFKLNGKRQGALITYRSPYPGGGYNTAGASSPEYMQIEPGTYDFSFSVPNSGTTNDSISLYNGKITLEKGKNHSLHIADTAGNIKHVFTTDNTDKPASGTARYKFVNLIPNATAVDLYLGDSLIIGNLNYLNKSDYFILNVPQVTTRAWNVRAAGSAANSTPIATYSSSATFTNQRVYTIFALGYNGKTTSTQKPYVSLFLEK